MIFFRNMLIFKTLILIKNFFLIMNLVECVLIISYLVYNNRKISFKSIIFIYFLLLIKT